MSGTKRSSAAKIFYACAEEDVHYRDKLQKHLRQLERDGFVAKWEGIQAGQETKSETQRRLDSADIILLLVSPDFIGSDELFKFVVPRAMERHAKGEGKVVPVILRPVLWQGERFEDLAPLPANKKPISMWDDEDEAFVEVAEGIRKILPNQVYVPDCRWDVCFTSAKPTSEAELDWVNWLAAGLKKDLAGKLGGHFFSLRTDGGESVSSGKDFEDTASLVVVVSPGHLSSERCRAQLGSFCKNKPDCERMIFVVELQPRARLSDYPPEFASRLGYPFWRVASDGYKPLDSRSDVDRTDYHAALGDLAGDVAATLRELKDGPPAVPSPRATVFLADVDHKLIHSQRAVRRFLLDPTINVKVLPSSWHDRMGDGLRAALNERPLFVSLGAKSQTAGNLTLQDQNAESLGLPILQWRGPNPNVDDDLDGDSYSSARELFKGPLADFKSEIVDSINRLSRPQPPSAPEKKVAAYLFVNCTKDDHQLADEIATIARKRGFQVELNRFDDAIREDIDAKLPNADGVLVICGKNAGWVRFRMKYIDKTASSAGFQTRVVGLYVGPRADKQQIIFPHKERNQLGLWSQTFVIDCSRGLDENELEPFFAALEGDSVVE